MCRAQRQPLHPKKLRVIPVSAEAAEAAAVAAEAPTAMMSFALPSALSKPPSKVGRCRLKPAEIRVESALVV